MWMNASQSLRKCGKLCAEPELPSCTGTFLFTDIEESIAHVRRKAPAARHPGDAAGLLPLALPERFDGNPHSRAGSRTSRAALSSRCYEVTWLCRFLPFCRPFVTQSNLEVAACGVTMGIIVDEGNTTRDVCLECGFSDEMTLLRATDG
jgi:hypothetical protein